MKTKESSIISSWVSISKLLIHVITLNKEVNAVYNNAVWQYNMYLSLPFTGVSKYKKTQLFILGKTSFLCGIQ